MSALVHAAHAAGLATLTLDSRHNRNALSGALIAQLLDAIAAASANDGVRAIVLSHTGSVFCSGADLKETAALVTQLDADPSGRPALPAARLGELLTAIWECPKPVIVRVGGPARAGGLGLIAAADIAICSETATFSFSEVRLGVVPAVVSAAVIPRLTPRGASELFLTGEVFGGRRAVEVGLVTACVAPQALDDAVARYASALLRGAPRALAVAKQLARRKPAATIAEDLAELTPISVRFFSSPEGREGMRAYADKRDPYWIHPS